MAVLALFWIFVSAVIGTEATRDQRNEHKVHNIVLFPEKHAWCNLTRIRQIVSHPGCESVEIDNSVCVGACFSYTVPQTSPPTPGDDLLHYCDSCQQADFEWRVVSLECKESKTAMLKHVQIINNCTCAKCQETPAVTPEKKLSNEVDGPDASRTPEFISSVRRGKVPDGVRQELLRNYGEKIRGLNSQFVDYNAVPAGGAVAAAAGGANADGHDDDAEEDYDYSDDDDGARGGASHGSNKHLGNSHNINRLDDESIQAARTGPDLHLTHGLLEDSLPNDVKAVEHHESTAASAMTPQSMMMATTTNAPTSPSSNRVLLPPPPLLDEPDLISNSVDAVPGHHHHHHHHSSGDGGVDQQGA